MAIQEYIQQQRTASAEHMGSGPLQVLIDETLANIDTTLLKDLAQVQPAVHEPHPSLQPFLGPDVDPLEHLSELNLALDQLGTAKVAVRTERMMIDGITRELTFVEAIGSDAQSGKQKKERHHMEGIWARDQAFIAWSLLEQGRILHNDEMIREGNLLMDSLLYCLSTKSQLQKIDKAIETKGKIKAAEHPAIRYEIILPEDDQAIPTLNLDVDWRHNQDALAIVAALSLMAVERGTVEPAMVAHYREFFTRIPHFLQETSFLTKASQGSWEEIDAPGRLSTIIWEAKALFGMYSHAEVLSLDSDTRVLLPTLIHDGAQAVVDRFPFESNLVSPQDPAYREADAAILYAGLAEFPELVTQLEDWGIPPIYTDNNPRLTALQAQGYSLRDAMYQLMFDTVAELQHPTTKGIARYAEDLYQAGGFYLPAVHGAFTNEQSGIWCSPAYREDDNGTQQYVARQQLMTAVHTYLSGSDVVQGKVNLALVAGWMHPNTQAADSALRLAGQTDDPEMKATYLARGKHFLCSGLSMITYNDSTIRPGANGPEIVPMKDGIAPECIIGEPLPNGEILYHPGPWGPLMWSAAGTGLMMARARELVTES